MLCYVMLCSLGSSSILTDLTIDRHANRTKAEHTQSAVCLALACPMQSAMCSMHSAVCPITMDMMTDPVMAADGHTYERDALLRWLRTSNISPATGAQLANRTVIPNYCVKMFIQELSTPWRCSYFCWWLLSHVPRELMRVGFAVLLFIQIGDAQTLRLCSSLLLERTVHATDAASLAALATLCGGLLFSMSVLVANDTTKVAACVLSMCCFSCSCGLMAAPQRPINEVLSVSRVLLMSGFALCCLGMYLIGSAEPVQAADARHELAAPSEPDPAWPARPAPARVAPARAPPAPAAPVHDAPAHNVPARTAIRSRGQHRHPIDLAQLHADVITRCTAWRQLHAEALHVTRRLSVRLVRARK